MTNDTYKFDSESAAHVQVEVDPKDELVWVTDTLDKHEMITIGPLNKEDLRKAIKLMENMKKVGE